MLRLILDRGDVAIPPESMFLLDVHPGQPADDVLRTAWDIRACACGARRRPAAAARGTERRRRSLRGQRAVRSLRRRRRKRRWGDKTPAYIRHVDRLATIWPDARFVVLVRDGRDVALSVMGVPFGPNNAWAAARSWATAVRQGREAAARYPAACSRSATRISWRARNEVQTICSLRPRVFARHARDRADRALEGRRGPGRLVHECLVGITTAAVGKWRTELTPRQVEMFESVAGDELHALGYATNGATTSPALVPAYAVHDAAMRGVNFVRLRLVQERGREVRHVVKRKLSR